MRSKHDCAAKAVLAAPQHGRHISHKHVALWRWIKSGAPELRIIDPEGRLPRTPASWV